jgi:hypothetical protein
MTIMVMENNELRERLCLSKKGLQRKKYKSDDVIKV